MRWIPREAFHFSVRRLLFLTTTFALVMTFAPSVHHLWWVSAAATLYLLFVMTWCILISYTVYLRMRKRRNELVSHLDEEYQQAKARHTEQSD